MIDLESGLLTDWRKSTHPLAVFSFEDSGLATPPLPTVLRKALAARAAEERFKGKSGECVSVSVYEDGRDRRFFLFGLGKKKALKAEGLRKAGGALYRFAKKRCDELAVLPVGDAQALAEGFLLGSYRFEEYKKPEDDLSLKRILVLDDAKAKLDPALARARIFAESVCLVRDLVNRGPSDKPPESLGRVAQSLSGDGVACKLIDRDEAEQLGMGSFLSVTRGSSIPPCFVHLSYKPKGAKRKVAVVGKGITFDSGGLSLKPAQSMEDMKGDMAGAASVLAVFKALPRLKLKVEVHGICAFAYNMPGPDATKPGDIAKAMNGKTIEILNTDAEGRLVLADALTYAARQGVESIVELSTLTGAQLVALGSSVSAAMTNDAPLLRRLFSASEKTGEKIWELPLVPEYAENIKGGIADLRNISKVRGEAGTIIGGLFLKEFVEDKPFVHLDIAGPAWANSTSDYCPAGGTGAMVRTLLEYLCAL